MRRWIINLRIILVTTLLTLSLTTSITETAVSTEEIVTPQKNILHYELTAELTAYTPFDEGCSGIAFDGNPAVPYRTIAVDPDVIPLGSVVRIVDVSTHLPDSVDEVFVAHDTGGAIVGQRIDVCVRSVQEAYRFGRRNMRVIVYSDQTEIANLSSTTTEAH